jgi:hypothetical protein
VNPTNMTLSLPGPLAMTQDYNALADIGLWTSHRVLSALQTITGSHFAWTGSTDGTNVGVIVFGFTAGAGQMTVSYGPAIETDSARPVQRKSTRYSFGPAIEADSAMPILMSSKGTVGKYVLWQLDSNGYPALYPVGVGHGFAINRRSGTAKQQVDGWLQRFIRPDGVGASAAFGICFRSNDDPESMPYSGYTAAWFCDVADNAWLELSSWTDGVPKLLKRQMLGQSATPENIRAIADGSDIQVLLDNSPQIELTNNEHPNGAYGGLYAWRNVEAPTIEIADFDIKPYNTPLKQFELGYALETDQAGTMTVGSNIVPLTTWSGTNWTQRI